MRTLSRMSVFVLAVSLLLAAPALAERTATAVPLTHTILQSATPDGSPAKVPAGCQVGNLNSPAWAIPGWAFPPEAYFLNFLPLDSCPNCGLGFNVTAVHFYVQTDGPCEIDLSVGLYGTDFSDPNCPLPGPSDCVSPYYTVTLNAAGLWDVNIPVDCPCADPNYLYALGVDILDYRCDSGAYPDIITDDFPTNCTSWNEYGLGPVDLVADAGFPGNLIMFADTQCCEPAVGLEESSWGRVKGLYGNE